MADSWRTRPLPADWPTTRRRILKRDRHTCRACGARATDVDHVVPASEGGTDADSNLQALCPPCHRRKTAAEAARARARRPGRTRPREAHPGRLMAPGGG